MSVDQGKPGRAARHLFIATGLARRTTSGLCEARTMHLQTLSGFPAPPETVRSLISATRPKVGRSTDLSSIPKADVRSSRHACSLRAVRVRSGRAQVQSEIAPAQMPLASRNRWRGFALNLPAYSPASLQAGHHRQTGRRGVGWRRQHEHQRQHYRLQFPPPPSPVLELAGLQILDHRYIKAAAGQ